MVRRLKTMEEETEEEWEEEEEEQQEGRCSGSRASRMHATPVAALVIGPLVI